MIRQYLSTSFYQVSKAMAAKFIGTHNGTFHCDDVTACFMLKQLDRFKDHEIIRTRDEIKLAQAEIVVDVGSVLDVEKLRLDHHQRSFMQTIHDYHPNIKVTNPEKPVRLSSSGLVYAVFGKDLISKLTENEIYSNLDEPKKRKIDEIYEKAYTEFFEEIDAIDNGVEIASGENTVYNYNINSGISSRVGRLNPRNDDPTDEERLEQFKKAMEMVGEEIIEGIDFLDKIWWPKKQEFRGFFLNRKSFHPSGQVVQVDKDNLIGWKSSIIDLEEEFGIEGEVKFIIYNDGSEASPWRTTGVPSSLKSFSLRVPLKEEWRGLRDEKLQEVSGIKDATFVHMSGFTGGAKSLGGIRSMVMKTLGLE